MSRMSLPMVLERERVAKLKKAQQSGQKQATKSAAAPSPRGPGFGPTGMFAGPAPQPKPGAPIIPPGQPLTTRSPAERATVPTALPPRRFPTFEAEAAHAKRLQGLSAAVPLPTRPASATPPQVGPTKAELTRMRPNDGPQPQTPAAPPDDRARLLGREREIRQFLEAQKRNSLVGLSPGFTAEDAAAANQTALARDQAKDIALLLREPERRGRTADQIQSARSSLREQGFDFARQQLEAAIPPERLAQIESGAAVELTPEERAAIEEFDRIGGGLNKSLPAIPDQIGREMARGEAERAKAANQRLIDKQAVLRQEGSTFQTDEAARRDRDLATVREREIQAALQKAAIAQAQQVGREAGGGSESDVNDLETKVREAQAKAALQDTLRQTNPALNDTAEDVATILVKLASNGLPTSGDSSAISALSLSVADLKNQLQDASPEQRQFIKQALRSKILLNPAFKDPRGFSLRRDVVERLVTNVAGFNVIGFLAGFKPASLEQQMRLNGVVNDLMDVLGEGQDQ